jgi:hypothetical protein
LIGGGIDFLRDLKIEKKGLAFAKPFLIFRNKLRVMNQLKLKDKVLSARNKCIGEVSYETPNGRIRYFFKKPSTNINTADFVVEESNNGEIVKFIKK